MEIIRLDPEIYRVDETGRSTGIFTKQLPTSVDWNTINQLVDMAETGGGKSIRLCLHDNPDASFHTMIIVDKEGTYYRPHKHIDKGECFHIIRGRLAIFTFDEEGTVTDSCQLEPEQTIMYRVAVNCYHAVMALSPTVVYHESKPGPYLQDDDSVFPPWAPDNWDEAQITRYCEELSRGLH